jgi:hypothetical protein
VPSCRLVDVCEPAQRGHDVDPVTVAEHAEHGDTAASCSRFSGVGSSSVTVSIMTEGCHAQPESSGPWSL